MEDPWNMAESMLSDVLVSNVYSQFIHQNSILFKDKIVLDVGCRSGLLSILAVEAGAVKVFAVGNMQSAKYVAKALAKGDKAEVFEPLTGCISQIRLPCGLRKVDIIVSEWMGHAIFADSLFCQVMFARDKWLAKGGRIIPYVASLYIRGVELFPLPGQSADKDLPPVLLREDYVPAHSIMTERFLLKTIDLSTAKSEVEFFIADFKVHAMRGGKVTGCMLYFEISSINAKGQVQKLFSIGPESPKTYLKQTLLLLAEDALEVAEHQLLVGKFSLAVGSFAPRGVEFSLGLWTGK